MIRRIRIAMHRWLTPPRPAVTPDEAIACVACGDHATTTAPISLGHRRIVVDVCGPCSARSTNLLRSLVEDALAEGRVIDHDGVST